MNDNTEQIHSTQTAEHITPPPRRKPRRWLMVLLGILILISGMVIGAGMTVIVGRRMVRQFMDHPERLYTRTTNRLRKSLDLSDEQTDEVREIVEERLGALIEIHREVRPKVEEQLRLFRDEVTKILDEDQLDSWNKHFIHIERALLPPHHPPPHKGR